MDTINLRDLQLIMLIGMFVLGFITFIIGVTILVKRTWGREIRSVTAQTTRLAQKGLADEISGLVGNASSLLNTLNDMVRTATGVGIFLTISGALLMSITSWLVMKM